MFRNTNFTAYYFLILIVLQEIFIRFFGSAYTHWTEVETHTESHYHRHSSFGHHSIGHHSFGHGSHGHWHSHTVHENFNYQAYEQLFDFAIRLFGDGQNTFRIPTGNSVFPFVFQVPTRPLPVTCNFEDGHVMYGLEGRIRKPWYQFDPKTDILPVTLFTMVDLNISPGAGNPMQVTDARSFGCCCPSKPCTIQSFSPKLGFCPGEIIPFVVDISNLSDRQIMNVTATLTQVWTLYSDNPQRGRHHRTKPIALQSAGRHGVAPGEITKWSIEFTVPPTVPPTQNPYSCRIIQLEYNINVFAVVDGCCRNESFGINHPIIVGTIPLVPPVVVTSQTATTPQYDEKGGLA